MRNQAENRISSGIARLLFGTILLVVAFPIVAAEKISVEGTFVHSNSHFSFPTNVGAFRRVNLSKYDREGKNVSAGYNLVAPMLTVTIYVYPAPKNVAVLPQKRSQGVSNSLISHHFLQITNEITRARPTAKVRIIKDEGFELVQGGTTRKGRHAVFAYAEQFAGFVQPVQSELFLLLLEPDTMFLIDGRFYVKIRSTYPASGKEQAEAELQKFLNTFVWPTK